MTNEKAATIINLWDDPMCPATAEERTEAKKIAIAALERDKWISVEERLPERYKKVLTAAKGDRVRENFLISADRNEWSYDSRGVTHWRELPAEPPKEET